MKQTGPGPYLEGKCLVAMPALHDNIFARSVVYICAHSEDGAMGLILNHPAEGVNFVDLLLQLKVIEAGDKSSLEGGAGDKIVLTGGPVDSSRGFVTTAVTVDFSSPTPEPGTLGLLGLAFWQRS